MGDTIEIFVKTAMLAVTIGIAAVLLVLGYQAFHVLCIKRLRYHRYFSEEGVFAGENLKLVEEVSNHFFLPMISVDVESYVVSELRLPGCESEDEKVQHFISHYRVIWPFTAIRRSYDCVAEKRGYYKLESAKVLFAGEDVFLDSQAELYVYPPQLELEEEAAVNRYLQYNRHSNLSVIPDRFSFAGIREYRSTDSFHAINFKASAKRDEWMVNDTDYLMGRQMMVYLNFQSEGSCISLDEFSALMERALSYVSYLFSKAMEQGYRFGFGANCRMTDGAYYLWHPLGTGQSQYNEILREMAMARPMYGNSFRSVIGMDIERGLGQTEVYALTDYMDEGISDALETLRQMGNTIHVVLLEQESI